MGGTDGGADASPDAPDGPPVPMRIRDGLIALWTFDEQTGTKFALETSGAGTPVPLEVITSTTISPPSFANGNLVALQPARLVSAENSRLSSECAAAGAVTLEAWILPTATSQGSSTEPAFVAGLAANVGQRNIAILQAGDRWLGLVRTTAAQDGTPALLASNTVSLTGMTHVALVADGARRALYVNNEIVSAGAAGGPMSWDPSFPMALVDEYQHGRQWTGTVALVALYRRALTPEEIMQNWVLGPTSP